MPVMTRQDLFNAAWSQPLARVAAALGVTAVELRKICDRHDIPTPGRGYWTAVAAGGVFKTPPLPSAESSLEPVHIAGSGAPPLVVRPPEAKGAVAQTKRVRAAKAEVRAPSRPNAAPQPEPSNAPEYPAPELPHLALSLDSTLKALAQAELGNDGFLKVGGKGVAPMVIGPASCGRALTWLNSFVASAESRGWTFRLTNTGAELVVFGEHIGFRIQERDALRTHHPTAKELAMQARREQLGYRSLGWSKYDRAPSGRLSVVIEANRYGSLRRTYADRKRQSLETMLDPILDGFAAHARDLQDRRREEEERQRRAAAAEARRQRLAAYRERERSRMAFVGKVAAALEKRQKLEAVLRYAEAADQGERHHLETMMAWLRRRIVQLDARLSPEFLDLSARSANIDFDEVAQSRLPPKPRWHYSNDEPRLLLWRLDGETGMGHEQSALEWNRAAGLLDGWGEGDGDRSCAKDDRNTSGVRT